MVDARVASGTGGKWCFSLSPIHSGAEASWRPPRAGAAPTPNPSQVLARDVHYRFEHFQKLARRQWEFLGLSAPQPDSDEERPTARF